MTTVTEVISETASRTSGVRTSAVVTDSAPTGTTLVANSPACVTGRPPNCTVTDGAGNHVRPGERVSRGQ